MKPLRFSTSSLSTTQHLADSRVWPIPLMQFCEIERFPESASQARGLDCIRGRPFHRHQVTGARWLGRCTLPMAARETERSDLPDIGLFRYFVFAHTQRAGDDWAGASVTRVCGQVKVLFPHCGFLGDVELMCNARPLWLRYLVTIALALQSWN